MTRRVRFVFEANSPNTSLKSGMLVCQQVSLTGNGWLPGKSTYSSNGPRRPSVRGNPPQIQWPPTIGREDDFRTVLGPRRRSAPEIIKGKSVRLAAINWNDKQVFPKSSETPPLKCHLRSVRGKGGLTVILLCDRRGQGPSSMII